jgi:hypothetical protein
MPRRYGHNGHNREEQRDNQTAYIDKSNYYEWLNKNSFKKYFFVHDNLFFGLFLIHATYFNNSTFN